MRVFVAGATGALGRALLPQMAAAGHEVLGLARTPEKLLQVIQLGAEALRGDVLDADAMRRLIREARPDAVINLATAIPLKLRIHPKDWEQNDRVRVEGTRNLLSAAQEAGVGLYVQESVGYICASQGAGWITEDTPCSTHSFLRATVQMEDLVRASSLPTTLLRFAALMSSESWHTQQSIAALRRGFLPIIGEGDAYLSIIHLDDAVAALLSVLASPEIAAGQTYNVVDNEPAPMREVFPYAAAQLNAPAPKHIPPFVAKMAVGSVTMEVLTASYRMSNRRIREQLGFAPRYPTYRETWAQIAQEMGGREISLSEDLK